MGGGGNRTVHGRVQWGQRSVLSAGGCTAAAAEICPLSVPRQTRGYREKQPGWPPHPGHGAEQRQGEPGLSQPTAAASHGPGFVSLAPLESNKLADRGNCLAQAGFENKIPFQPLPFSTAGNQKLLRAEMRYGFSGAELGTGTRSCALVPTAKLALPSCGHGARSVRLTRGVLSSFLCPGLGIIFVCAGTGWSGFGSAQAGKWR